MRSLVTAVLSVCLLATPLSAGQSQAGTSSGTPAPITRDPTAIAVLQQALAASGTTGASLIQDSTETGTITYNWAGKQVQGTVTLRGRNTDEFRFDASLYSEPNSLSWAVMNSQGTLQA